MRTQALIAGLPLILLACPAEPEPEPEVEVREDVPAHAEDAIEIARAIEADPDRAEQILEARGMTMSDLEDLLFHVADDPEAARAYAQAVEEDITE